MSCIEALLLGIVQGITEFLPISSSGHLFLARLLMNIQGDDNCLTFDLVCHCGTLCALILFFWRDIVDVCTTKRRELFLLFIALLPMSACYPFLNRIESFFAMPEWLWLFFLITSMFLFIGGTLSMSSAPKNRATLDVLILGLSQTLALFPGVSRSGVTISSARFLGWEPISAARFSFLMAIPTILGGIILHLSRIVADDRITYIVSPTYAIGFIASFICGYYSLRLVIAALRRKRWTIFAWYCLIVSILTLIYCHYA